jgi:hypothetical protein
MKRVIFGQDSEIVKVEDCNPRYIYILKTHDNDFYKLHQCQQTYDPFVWCSLSDSHFNRNGACDTFDEALKSVKPYGKIYEFEFIRDFAQWLAEEAPL